MAVLVWLNESLILKDSPVYGVGSFGQILLFALGEAIMGLYA
jgi:hypothetical protein